MSESGEKYCPSNGTEGEIFMSEWCHQCARDKHLSEGKYYDECTEEETCGIIACTMAYDIEDEDYPTEWTYDSNGEPCCTAFIRLGDELPTPRCAKTPDMFY